MFSHIFVSMSDFDRALRFYAELMKVIGNELRFCEFHDPEGNKVRVVCHQPEAAA